MSARLEETLRESGARYRSLFENALEGIFLSTLEGRCIEVNPALVHMLGYESVHEVLALQLPNDLCVDSAEQERLQAVCEITGVVKEAELRWKKKDGTHIVVNLRVRTIHDAQGTLAGYEGMVLDITECKRVDEALQESEERYRNLFENANDGIATFTLDGIITSVNRGGEWLL